VPDFFGAAFTGAVLNMCAQSKVIVRPDALSPFYLQRRAAALKSESDLNAIAEGSHP
jgi:hypothetical protein